jgi:hypothetical protein
VPRRLTQVQPPPEKHRIVRPIRLVSLPPFEYQLNDNVGSCTITSFVSPAELFVQLAEKNQFDELYTNLHETYLERISCDQVDRLRSFAVHAIGVARNQRDQRFYRVQILKHQREQRTLLVICIDIGEYLTISETSIYELLAEYQRYPAQAIKCTLATIRCAMGEWPRESINLLNRFVGGKGFKTFRFYSMAASNGTITSVKTRSHDSSPSFVHSLNDPAMPIVLFDPNHSAQSINEQLVERNFAVPDENFAEIVRLANETINDLFGIKTQRIHQFIESQQPLNDDHDGQIR